MTPTQKLRWRNALAAYYRLAERNRLNWDYTRKRRYTGLGLPASGKHEGDCSSYGPTGFKWATKQTGVKVSDPLGFDYDGAGDTGSALAFLRSHPAPDGRYLVGDAAIFGTPADTIHIIWCRQKGDRTTAIWSSHGHEATILGDDAPEPLTLSIAARRQPLIGVYRPRELL